MVLGGAQLLAMGEVEGPQSSPGGIADRSGVGSVGRSGVVRRASPQAPGSLQMFPDVDLGDKVAIHCGVGDALGDAEGLHGASQLLQHFPEQRGKVARLIL